MLKRPMAGLRHAIDVKESLSDKASPAEKGSSKAAVLVPFAGRWWHLFAASIQAQAAPSNKSSQDSTPECKSNVGGSLKQHADFK